MANINFGLLDTQYPEKLANAFVRSPEQQNANMLQAMQMKHLIDQSDQAQYAISKARREDAGMAEFGNAIKALGPDPSLLAIAQVFMKHPNPEYQLKGFELQKQARADQGYRDLGPMGGAAAAPTPAPAPGSFGENMLANRAGLPFFGDKPPAVTAGAAAPAAPMTEEGRMAEIQPRLALLRPHIKGSTDAKAEYDMLMAELIELRKPETIAPGSIRRKAGYATFTAPEASSQDIRTMQALGYPNTQAGYTAFRDAQRPDRLLSPAEEEQQLRLRAASRAPGATVVMPPLEKSESQEKGKLNVKAYGVIADTADRARKILPALETSEAILNNGFKTGFSANVQTQAARVLGALGVPEADKYATDSQVFLAQGRQALLQRQLEQKGAQSEGDAQRINQTFIQLGNTPEANKFLVATAKAQSKQDIARQKFYSTWWSKSKTYEGAEEAWLEGDGGKSLFDSPDMKQFAPKTQQSDIAAAAAAEIARRKGTPR